MGVSIREHHGSWYLFIRHKQYRRAVRVGKKRAAEAAQIQVQAKLAAGDLSPLQEPSEDSLAVTFGSYAAGWLKDHADHLCKPATRRFYSMNLRLHVNPTLGPKALARIRRADCTEVIKVAREKGLTPNSLDGIARTMSTVLSQAVEEEILPANPAFRLGKHIGQKGRKRATDIRPFTREESAAFLAAANEHMPEFYPFVLCALRTGMRLGELLALEWTDIDWRGQFIEVQRNISAGIEGTPKNGKSRRVDTSDKLKEELERLLVTRKTQKLANGWKDLPAKVFCAPEGGPLDGDNVRHRMFYKLLTKAKIRRVRFHDLRHTFASQLIQNGESLMYVKEQLGHGSIQITADTYGHLIPGANRQAVNRLDEDIAPVGPQTEAATA